jgi:hypothetical protein
MCKGWRHKFCFFHHAVVKRKIRNSIVSIKDENDVLQSMPEKISNTFVSYFRLIFAPVNTNNGRPLLEQLTLKIHRTTNNTRRRGNLGNSKGYEKECFTPTR